MTQPNFIAAVDLFFELRSSFALNLFEASAVTRAISRAVARGMYEFPLWPHRGGFTSHGTSPTQYTEYLVGQLKRATSEPIPDDILSMQSRADAHDLGGGHIPSSGYAERRNVVDWVRSIRSADPRAHGKLERMQWADMVRAASNWHEALERKRREANAIALGTREIVHAYDDGWKWVWVATPEQKAAEGSAMGHCVGQGGYGTATIVSLRDPAGKPHVTAHVHADGIGQCSGTANTDPRRKYGHYLTLLFKRCRIPEVTQQTVRSLYAKHVRGISAAPIWMDDAQLAADRSRLAEKERQRQAKIRQADEAQRMRMRMEQEQERRDRANRQIRMEPSDRASRPFHAGDIRSPRQARALGR